ncbi:MAG: hypothetical protein HYW48_11745 [Deltaproteobacteria bacterium]|nr:hypothetical protein [Deltaproteobacteria bacterium]
MEETAQLVPPRNPLGEATLPSPPQTPLSLFAPSDLRITRPPIKGLPKTQ